MLQRDADSYRVRASQRSLRPCLVAVVLSPCCQPPPRRGADMEKMAEMGGQGQEEQDQDQDSTANLNPCISMQSMLCHAMAPASVSIQFNQPGLAKEFHLGWPSETRSILAFRLAYIRSIINRCLSSSFRVSQSISPTPLCSGT